MAQVSQIVREGTGRCPLESWGLLGSRKRFYFTLLLLSQACFLGCGSSHPPTFPVQGKVEFEDGEPVRIGSVEFRLDSDERVISRGKIQENGTFQLTTFEPNDGALEGTHLVAIHQLIIAEDTSFKAHGHGRRVSPKYSEFVTSGLSATVKAVPKSDRETNKLTLRIKVDPNDKKAKSK